MIYLPIGIAIDASRVAAVLVSSDGEQRRIENVVVEKHDGTDAGMSAAFVSVRSHLRGDQRACIFALGEDVALLDRYVDTTGQATAEKKIDQSAYYHARRVFRAQMKGEDSAILVDADSSQNDAMWLSLVQSPQLARLVRAARAAGLRPVAATHNALALKRALPGVDAVVQYEINRASIVLLSEPTPLYEHVSVESLVEGSDNFDSVRRLAAVAGGRVEELRNNYHKINRLTITGRRERLDSFQSALAAQLRDSVVVDVADLSGLPAALPPDVIARYSPEVAAAFGAALYGNVEAVPDLDLLRADYSQTVSVIRETPHLRNGVLAVVASVVVALFAHHVAHARLSDVQARLPHLRASIDAQAQTAAYVDAVEERYNTLNTIAQKIVAMRASANQRVYVAVSVLNALPSWAAVSEIKRDGEGWTVQGYAPDEGHVGEIMAQLRRTKNIVDVSHKGIENRGKRMEFTLHLQVADGQ